MELYRYCTQYLNGVGDEKLISVAMSREIIAVCSQIHTKHINTLCGQNTGFSNARAAGTGNYRCAVWA